MSELLLIDGHAILHRAYHALPPLTNKDGIQTNAVYGFMTMLLRLLDTQQPTHIVVAFDLPQPTFRQQQYTQYQAKRPEMEGNLKDQIPLIHTLLDRLNIKYFEVPGYEADDVIGTLATQVVRSSEYGVRSKKHQNISPDSRLPTPDSCEVVIVTGDRDMLQLVNKNVKVLVPVKGLGETKTYDEDLIIKEFGVTSSQWVDVKALKGDASDNYLGVRGIGPKTAQELVGIYGNLEGIYRNLSKIKPQVARKLAEGAESAGLSKKLATIVTDVPVHLDLETAKTQNINWAQGTKFMREKLGFRTIVDKIERSLRSQSKSKTTSHEPLATSSSEQLGLI